MHIRFLASVLIGVVALSVHGVEPAANVEAARLLVKRALEAEAAGDNAGRQALLEQANQAGPDVPAVHWQLGQVRSGDSWKTYEALATDGRNSKVLQAYREQRDASEPTVASQRALALYCERNKLPAQAEVHWSAVLELEPENADARRHLKFERYRDRWLKQHDIAAERAQATRVAAALRRLMPELNGLVSQLAAGTLTVERATEELLGHAEPAAIPAWESLVSTKSSDAALAVVGALGTMKQPESALSLARHALSSEWPQVRQEASRWLKERDENSYLPALLAELRGPWIGWREVANNGQNQLVYRFIVVADGPDQQSLRVLDQAYFLHGSRAMAASVAGSSANLTGMQMELLRQQENRRINAHNDRVMQLLAQLTGEFLFDSPQDWWQWWDNRNEVFLAEGKPIDTSYAFRSTNLYAPPPTPPVIAGGGGGVRTREATKKDCLAGGTPLLTQRGLVAVERVRIGDLVLSQHPETGEVALQPVLRTTVREPQPLIRITLGNESLRASGGHPFWVSGKGWLRARQLEPGMHLHGLAQGTKITEVEVEEKATRTFNLVVANFHTFFVGPGKTLSHDNSSVAAVSTCVPGLVKE